MGNFNTNTANGADPTPPGADNKKTAKTWRAKESCTYKGAFVAKGQTVQAEDMKNPHFEPVEKAKE
jgi:hypothetical protein